MANKKISELSQAASINTTALILVSEDIGGGNYISESITYYNLQKNIDGDLNVNGDITFDPLWNKVQATGADIEATASNAASKVVYGLGISWVFTNVSSESVLVQFPLPDNIDITIAPVVWVVWSTPQASAGECRWQVEDKYYKPNQDVSSTSVDQTLAANCAASTTSAGLVPSPFTLSVLPDVDDLTIRAKITRRIDEPGDTIADDVYLNGVVFRYKTTTLGSTLY